MRGGEERKREDREGMGEEGRGGKKRGRGGKPDYFCLEDITGGGVP
jgi:hypothetical protein